MKKIATIVLLCLFVVTSCSKSPKDTVLNFGKTISELKSSFEIKYEIHTENDNSVGSITYDKQNDLFNIKFVVTINGITDTVSYTLNNKNEVTDFKSENGIVNTDLIYIKSYNNLKEQLTNVEHNTDTKKLYEELSNVNYKEENDYYISDGDYNHEINNFTSDILNLTTEDVKDSSLKINKNGKELTATGSGERGNASIIITIK